MANNRQLLFATRLRGFTAGACGHAMSFDPEWKSCDVGLHTLAPITSVAHGIIVPISRGGPPVLTE